MALSIKVGPREWNRRPRGPQGVISPTMSTENPNRVAGTLKLIERDENAPKPLTGEQILELVGDVISPHLPTLSFDDPHYVALRILSRFGRS